MWVEFQGLDWRSIVKLRGRNAALSHFGLLIVVFKEHFDVPECDCSILHATSHDAHLIELINPVK